MVRYTYLAVCINKHKHIVSWNINSLVLALHPIVNDEKVSPKILKDKSLGTNEAKDQDMVQ